MWTGAPRQTVRHDLELSSEGLMQETAIETKEDGTLARPKRELVAGTALLLSLMSLALATGGIIMSQLTSAQIFETSSYRDAIGA